MRWLKGSPSLLLSQGRRARIWRSGASPTPSPPDGGSGRGGLNACGVFGLRRSPSHLPRPHSSDITIATDPGLRARATSSASPPPPLPLSSPSLLSQARGMRGPPLARGPLPPHSSSPSLQHHAHPSWCDFPLPPLVNSLALSRSISPRELPPWTSSHTRITPSSLFCLSKPLHRGSRARPRSWAAAFLLRNPDSPAREGNHCAPTASRGRPCFGASLTYELSEAGGERRGTRERTRGKADVGTPARDQLRVRRRGNRDAEGNVGRRVGTRGTKWGPETPDHHRR